MIKQHYPIMVVDDIHTNLVFISALLKTLGLKEILTCKDSRQVLSVLESHPIELLFLDIRMPYIDGYQLLSLINKKFPDLPVIIISEVSDITMAVKCMRRGAFDYITKPVDRDLFKTTLQRALKYRQLQFENNELKKYVHKMEDLENREKFSEIVTEHQKMIKIFKYIESIAKTSQPVFITGETGVGKELIAKVIHELSEVEGQLVSLNISGLDDTVFSDTLFGHAVGAYTGASKKRAGLIEKASGGTLFLDEVGDITALSQVKLLRLIQESEYFALGEDDLKISNTRIIVATNESVDSLLSSGKMRKDLIYRLKTHHIHIPPLRERQSDLKLLIVHFLKIAAEKLNKEVPAICNSTAHFLKTYQFPGNIRELQGMMFDTLSRNDTGLITPDLLRSYCFQNYFIDSEKKTADFLNHPAVKLPENLPTIKEMTSLLVKEAMQRASGRQTIAAKMLGISQPALSKRLKGI